MKKSGELIPPPTPDGVSLCAWRLLQEKTSLTLNDGRSTGNEFAKSHHAPT
jgi:hypothetical protein